MSLAQFQEFAAAGFNRIPVVREVPADLDTPLSIYLKLADGPYSYLFESVQGGEKWGRYSIIGLPCRTIVRVRETDIELLHEGALIETISVEDPLVWLEAFRARYRTPPVAGLPKFSGGLVGYFGYDTVRYIEPRLRARASPDTVGAPDILLMVSDEIAVLDNLAGKLYLIVHADPAQPEAWARANSRLDALAAALQAPLQREAPAHRAKVVGEEDFKSDFPRAKFEAAVERAKKYIVDGDIMQVVLSQRLSVSYHAAPLSLYRALRRLNPSPYMFYLDLDAFQIVGSSPEILVRVEDDLVTVRPIAGTRRRGQTEQEDRDLERELLGDPKELAEHLMLVDLGRNDVGRVAATGSVTLTEKMIVERYSHVMHIVSNVTGKLKPGRTALDVLRATFPAGTVSGAPKIRAMEIIAELEPVKRGVYAGAVGYLGWRGNMDTAISIRTAVIKDQTLHVQAGAGIVADSVPALEWQETMSKARAIFRAVALAESGVFGG